MNCVYHIESIANVNCNGCGKPLCPACDHRIKGFPFCQDCIVAGVELLRNKHQSFYVPIVKKHTSPIIAALLSVCPGLGAAYNGQASKALVHFLLVVGLFQMSMLTSGMAIFVLSFFGMWLFTALDAWRTAQLIRSGVTPTDAEDVLVRRFSGNARLWAVVLTVIGVSFVLQTFFNMRALINFILPALLIGLGTYLLRQYVVRSKYLASGRSRFVDDGSGADGAQLGSSGYGIPGAFAAPDDKRNWKRR